jgi:hypothetical protein
VFTAVAAPAFTLFSFWKVGGVAAMLSAAKHISGLWVNIP